MCKHHFFILKIKTTIKVLLLLLILLMATSSHAEIDWMSATLDNDSFVGNDNGYSNGLNISFYDVGSNSTELPSHDFWVWPLMWSIPKDNVLGAVNSYTFGQTMITPSDIEIEDPDEDELPYSALLYLTNNYISITSSYTDSARTIVGVVGPVALGEETQTNVHKIIGSAEPLGWDTQIENEIVFQFSRTRLWRTWVGLSDTADLLTFSGAEIGTIQSAIITGLFVRYGRDLESSYATTIFNTSRISNPTATSKGWYVYSGIQIGYAFNNIFTDGNTFRDSRSIDYDHESLGITMGLAYSWENFSLTFAVSDANIIQSGDQDEALENLTQYGTLTIAWRM